MGPLLPSILFRLNKGLPGINDAAWNNCEALESKTVAVATGVRVDTEFIRALHQPALTLHLGWITQCPCSILWRGFA